MILTCKCDSEYQDRRYGKGNRVHNLCPAKDNPKARCTVCSNVRSAND